MATTGNTEGVVHDASKQRFAIYSTADNQEIGYLEYEQRQPTSNTTVLDLQHTVVHPAGRGQGLAQKLCDAAFVYARDQGFKVIPTCSYISDTYLKRSTLPDAAHLVYTGQQGDN
ncbi:hypothetical protein H257_03356 [Aphanomyces astaci]|uniref:N-acetyltransferase domain-containing protein n=1 Tax=Aphanomyces astaci TaxID=112090 RepID=W4GWD7_APHAT|nr:hypothetical protein H257_03356 [Aphanomyces astaci]ETV83992.1 hypothetical protein H257_03356 [Aphanomyces astaci]|eukprot:XP_009825684.1 hypothetical protein H257_03356 [Aphanomyces astaci]